MDPSDASTTGYTQQLTVQSPSTAVLAALTTAAGLTQWWGPTTGTGGAGGTLQVRFPISDDPLVLRVTADAPGVVSWGVDQCPFLPDWVGTTPTFTLTADLASPTTASRPSSTVTSSVPPTGTTSW